MAFPPPRSLPSPTRCPRRQPDRIPPADGAAPHYGGVQPAGALNAGAPPEEMVEVGAASPAGEGSDRVDTPGDRGEEQEQ
jgi:hypothetical protein